MAKTHILKGHEARRRFGELSSGKTSGQDE
jgi:hypothetical protein